MARRRRFRDVDIADAIVRLVIGAVVLIALATGGVARFAKTFTAWLSLLLIALVIGVVGLLVVALWRRWVRQQKQATAAGSFGWQDTLRPQATSIRPFAAEPSSPVSSTWTPHSIETALGEIDWYQFEKFCAALLRSEGYVVERKGGAHPDGGVDLIATRNEQRLLVQCKHWRTWIIQERVVREMLGSMTDLRVTRGGIYTLKGWTKPSAEFAEKHQITLVDGRELARRGHERLSPPQLDDLLRSREHRCPKCESKMIWREGNFTPFWGCSTYPRCRVKLKQAGAR